MTGKCKFGPECTFAHGDNELKTRSRIKRKIATRSFLLLASYLKTQEYLLIFRTS